MKTLIYGKYKKSDTQQDLAFYRKICIYVLLLESLNK